MKRIFQRCILTAAAAVLLLAAMTLLHTGASAAEIAGGNFSENLTWSLDDAGTLVISGTGEMENFSTKEPWQLHQAPWVSQSNKVITVVIEEGVTGIGDYAFHECWNMTSVEIPDSVTRIGKNAFSECYSLDAVYITDMAAWCGINFDNFENERCNPLYYADELYLNEELVTDVVIPDGVTRIGTRAFYTYEKMTSITIPDGVTYIGEEAFYGCTGLTEITVPDSVVLIGGNAFSNCSSIESMTLPFVGGRANSNTYLGYIFGAEESMQNSQYVPESLKTVILSGACASIEPYAFYGCRNLTSVIISDGVTSIGSDAFASCFSLTSISIPDSITSIGSYAFNGCSSLAHNEYDNAKYLGNSKNPYVALVRAESTGISSCLIQENTRVICNNAFYYCTSLTDIAIPESVVSIGGSAFNNCSSLNAVYTSDIAAWCGIEFRDERSNPLYYAKKLYLNGELVTDVLIPDNATSIGDFAFYNFSNLTSIVIPDSVTSIGEDAFYHCSNLTDLVIPDSVTTIGNGALSGCSNLESLTIPFVGVSDDDGLSNSTHLFGYIFGKESFEGAALTKQCYAVGGPNGPEKCYTDYYIPKSLKTVTLTGGGTGGYTIPAGAFSDCRNITSIVLGENVTGINDWAFSWCRGLTTITFANTGWIEADAFEACSNLWHVLCKGAQISGNSSPEIAEATQHYNCSGDEVIDVDNKVCTLCCEHALDDAVTVPPTCTEQGYTIGTCTICGGTVQVDYVEALGHNGEWVADREATCTEDGSKSCTCTACGETETEIIPATGHAYKSYHTDATCTEDGYTTHTCTNCGDIYTDEHEPAPGHSYGAWTAVDDKYHKHTCGTCGKEETVAHNCQAEVTEPTCTTGGYTTHICVDCGHSYVDGQAPATGHVYVDGVCTDCHQPERELGDVNGDGAVDIFDANLAASYYNEVVELDAIQLQAADVNGDGAVDIFDANLIAAYYNEVIDAFPIQ